MVRVCLVGPSLGFLGGQAVQAQRLLEGLREVVGLEVEFLPVNPALPFGLARLQRVRYVRTLVTSVAYGISLLRHARRFDVIHAFSASYWSYLLAPLPALVIGRLYGRATILNYRSGEADDHLANWKSAVPTMRRFASRIVVPSGYLVGVFAKHDLEAVSIPNFVPVERLPYRHREQFVPRVLSNRNLEPLYNVAAVIRAFAIVQRSFHDAELVIVGDGSQRAELERLVEQLGVHGVNFVGHVAPSDMGRYYDWADVYLNAPNIDNMPGSILEAFACGLPVVTTNAGGIPFIVRDGENGLLVEAGDHEALGRAALRVLEDPESAALRADAARQECLERYTWPAVRREWEALYRDLAAAC